MVSKFNTNRNQTENITENHFQGFFFKGIFKRHFFVVYEYNFSLYLFLELPSKKYFKSRQQLARIVFENIRNKLEVVHIEI